MLLWRVLVERMPEMPLERRRVVSLVDCLSRQFVLRTVGFHSKAMWWRWERRGKKIPISTNANSQYVISIVSNQNPSTASRSQTPNLTDGLAEVSDRLPI